MLGKVLAVDDSALMLQTYKLFLSRYEDWSTEGKEEDTIRGLEMGAKGYVRKPFQAPELPELIANVWGRPPTELPL